MSERWKSERCIGLPPSEWGLESCWRKSDVPDITAGVALAIGTSSRTDRGLDIDLAAARAGEAWVFRARVLPGILLTHAFLRSGHITAASPVALAGAGSDMPHPEA